MGRVVQGIHRYQREMLEGRIKIKEFLEIVQEKLTSFLEGTFESSVGGSLSPEECTKINQKASQVLSSCSLLDLVKQVPTSG